VALEQSIVDPRVSTSIGYAESKWVAESLVLGARKQTGLRGGVVRVGQVSGDTTHGGWNKQEWVGAMAKAGQLVGALPANDDATVAWVPVDVVASSLVDMARSDGPVFNLVAPQPVPWATIFGAFGKRLGVPLIPYQEWVERVSAAADANTDQDNVSAFALADFFRDAQFGDQPMSTARAVIASHALREMQPLNEEDALRYLQYWGKIGHVKF
jgi:thioester reductase-like protein